MASDKIKVAVRVRPFNRRELELGTQCVVEMEGQQTVLQYPQSTHDKERRLREYDEERAAASSVLLLPSTAITNPSAQRGDYWANPPVWRGL
ncbi:jg13155 [Pararge aegeria aegeria]|uniref:Jg13155 protein n=1 Tax=Pararge aegeria aegeria TaxID=348720 RepID=A0A8S4RU10_9NEOP|nr:jg13155 [Pararge aegeria aegeria]